MKSKPQEVLKFFFGSTFLAIVNFTSIIGFGVLFVTKTYEAIIALIAFIIFLLVLIARAFWVTDQFLKNKSTVGYDKLSTSAKYMTRDGLVVIYELKKFIQCKQVVMNIHEHDYYWTGSNDPKISSETMKFDKIISGNNGFKKAIFKMPSPLIFNSVFVAHIKMEIDDSDKKSSTHLEQYVKDKTQLISFKIQLLYKKGNVPDARLCRRPLDAPNLPYEFIKAIPFDKKTSSYEHNLYEPEVGYSYRIEWVR